MMIENTSWNIASDDYWERAFSCNGQWFIATCQIWLNIFAICIVMFVFDNGLL